MMIQRLANILPLLAQLSERALELLGLPDDGIPKLLLDIGCGSGLSGETLSENGHQWIGLDISQSMLNIELELEVEGDLLLGDGGQGLGLHPGVIDGAISISAVNAFFGSLYKWLARGARAVFQIYPESVAQCELILSAAMQTGFAGGVVVDYPHSSKRRKEFLVLACDSAPSLSSEVPEGEVEDVESCSDDESNGDEQNQMVSVSDRHGPRKKHKLIKKDKGREWVVRKKK